MVWAGDKRHRRVPKRSEGRLAGVFTRGALGGWRRAGGRCRWAQEGGQWSAEREKDSESGG